MLRMFWRKPPPPKPKIPQWLMITAPFIFAIVIGLIGLVYNTMAEEINDVKDSIVVVEQKKVDNRVLKLMIEKDRQALQTQHERNKEQDKAIIENQRAIQQLLIKPPSLRIIPKSDHVSNQKILPPDLFEKYISMKPEVRQKYKKYLNTKGYDVSNLPE